MAYTENQIKAQEHVEKIMCKVFDIKKTDLMSRCRGERIATCRFFIWYILYNEYSFTARMIVGIYHREWRDVMHGISKIKNGIKNQPYYQSIYNDIITKVKPQS